MNKAARRAACIFWGKERGHVLSKWGTGNEKQGIRTSHGRIALEKRTGLGYNDFSYKKIPVRHDTNMHHWSGLQRMTIIREEVCR